MPFLGSFNTPFITSRGPLGGMRLCFCSRNDGQHLGSYELLAKYWKLDTQNKQYSISKYCIKVHLWILVPKSVIWFYFFNVWNPIQQWYDTWGNKNDCLFFQVMFLEYFCLIVVNKSDEIWAPFGSHQRKHVDLKRPYISWGCGGTLPVTVTTRGFLWNLYLPPLHGGGHTQHIPTQAGRFVSSVSSLRAIQVTWSYLASHATGPSRGIASWPFFMQSVNNNRGSFAKVTGKKHMLF